MRQPDPAAPLLALTVAPGEFDAQGRLTGIRGAIIDVSARAGAERELSRAARMRSVVFEATRMAAWHFDVATDRFACTDELLTLLDIERSHFDGTPKALEDAIQPGRPGSLAQGARGCAPLRQSHGDRIPPDGSGTQGALDPLARRIRAPEDGVAIESFGVMIDITERKSAEEDAARLAAIVESSEEAIIAKSLRGTITSWNKGAERLLGYSAEEMIGESIWKLIPEDGEHDEIEILNTIRTGHPVPSHESVRVQSQRPSDPRGGDGIPHPQSAGCGGGRLDDRPRRHGTQAPDRAAARERGTPAARPQKCQGRRMGLRPEEAGAALVSWMYTLYGLDPARGQPSREMLAQCILPEHRKRARKEFSNAILQGGSFTIEFPINRPDGSEIWTALAGDVIKDAQGLPVSARGISQDITERKNWEKRQAMLLRELSHRVKNTLAVVQSAARQTLRSSPDPKSFVSAFEGRIRSLAASHSLLTEADWSGAKLDTIIGHQVAALVHDYEGRFRLRGPDVVLSAEMATQIGLVLHELATNAVKYGALSVPEGRVNIAWSVTPTKLSLMWRETGGPAVERKPEFSGFGTLLIRLSTTRSRSAMAPGACLQARVRTLKCASAGRVRRRCRVARRLGLRQEFANGLPVFRCGCTAPGR